MHGIQTFLNINNGVAIKKRGISLKFIFIEQTEKQKLKNC